MLSLVGNKSPLGISIIRVHTTGRMSAVTVLPGYEAALRTVGLDGGRKAACAAGACETINGRNLCSQHDARLVYVIDDGLQRARMR